MKLLVLITCLSISQAFPSPKIESTKVNNAVTQVRADLPTTLPNLKMSLESPKHVKANKSSNYKEIVEAIEKINALKSGRSRTFGSLASFAVGGLLAALDLVEEVIIEGNAASIDEDTGSFLRMRRQEETTTQPSTMETTTNFQIPTATSDLPTSDPLTTTDFFSEITPFATTLSSLKIQEILNEVQENSTNIRQPRQEDEEEEEGGGGGLLAAIISGFLGSLSKPDGSVDVDAVVSVIGMLSAVRDDGTYDFQGLSDTLSAFFGGDEEGGSDVGGFAGGALAAVINGVANPPGAKGAGTFLGNLVKQVLPALSGPGPTQEGVTTIKPQVNAGGFLWGLLNSLFGNGGGGNNGMKPVSSFVTIKMNLVKFLFSALSSILAASSSSGKNKDW